MTLGDEYPKQQARCRDLLEQYAEIPPESRWFATAAIKAILKEADEAAISGDLPRMIAAFKNMQGCS